MTATQATAPPTEQRYGGHRLAPEFYEPARVPPEVARFAGGLDTLPVGSPGKVGVLQLEVARTPRATELVGHYQKSPLLIMRPLYYDPVRPDMPYVYLMSTGAGVMQGDRLRTDLVFGPGTSTHVTTTAFTKVLKMKHDYAVAQTSLDVGPGAFVEYLPDPVIAFSDARLYQRTHVRLHPGGTLVAGETFVAGRLALGERHEYAVVAADLEVERPDGTVVATDRIRLSPSERETGGLAVLGDHDVMSTLFVFTEQAPAREIADVLHEALAPARDDGVESGVSVLPGDSGAWVRLLGDDIEQVTRPLEQAWRSIRIHLTGHAAPAIRKN